MQHNGLLSSCQRCWAIMSWLWLARSPLSFFSSCRVASALFCSSIWSWYHCSCPSNFPGSLHCCLCLESFACRRCVSSKRPACFLVCRQAKTGPPDSPSQGGRRFARQRLQGTCYPSPDWGTKGLGQGDYAGRLECRSSSRRSKKSFSQQETWF